MKQGSAAVMVGQRVATDTRLGQLGMSDDGVRLAPVVVAGGTCP